MQKYNYERVRYTNDWAMLPVDDGDYCLVTEADAEIAALQARKLVFVPELSDDMKETYLEENIALQARIRGLEGALEKIREYKGTGPGEIAKAALKEKV